MNDFNNLRLNWRQWTLGSLGILVLVILVFLSAPKAHAQGCIVARTAQPVIGPLSAMGHANEKSEVQLKGSEERGGYLSNGKWQLTVAYRHLYSNQFFIGTKEQTQIVDAHGGDAVANNINLLNFELSYQLTPRWSFTGNIPLLFTTRHFPGYLPGFMTGPHFPGAPDQNSSSDGFGDVILTAQSWIWRPPTESRGNIAIAFGVQLPTGNDNYQHAVDTVNGPMVTTVDSSIQPGSGGWGIVLQSQGFKAVKKAVFYFDGSYILTPQDMTHTLSGLPGPLTYNSIPDSYLAEAGIAYPFPWVRGLSVTFGPRFEGVPVRDLIGSSNGFRRPGYAFSLEPGFEYSRGNNIVTFSLPIAEARNREQSVPERALGIHAGASFAKYVWLLNYTYRF